MQQDPDCLPSCLGNQFALDRFFGYQPYGPARIARRGIGADHRHDPLALTLVQQLCRTGSLPVVQRSIQPAAQIATTNLTDSFRIEPEIGSNLGGSLALVQWGDSQSTENDSHRLDSATEKTVQLFPVPLGQTDVETTIGPHDSV